MRNDSIVEFKKANRNDLIESYQKEIDILSEYMPKQLTDEEINKIIDDAIEETGAETVKDLGNIMRLITPKLKNRCDMKSVTNKIREKLI